MSTSRFYVAALCLVVVCAMVLAERTGAAGDSRPLSAAELSVVARGKADPCLYYLLTNLCSDQGTSTCGSKKQADCKGACVGCFTDPNLFIGTITIDKCLTDNIFGLNLSDCGVKKMFSCGVKFQDPTCSWKAAAGTAPAKCVCNSADTLEDKCDNYMSTTGMGPQPNACAPVNAPGAN